MERLIETDFADDADLDSAREALGLWRDNHAAFEDTLATSPALADIEPMSLALWDVSTIGLEALKILSAGETADAAWLRKHIEKLDEARAPHGQTELVVVDPVVRLVCAAAVPASAGEKGCHPEEKASSPAEH